MIFVKCKIFQHIFGENLFFEILFMYIFKIASVRRDIQVTGKKAVIPLC